MEEDISDSAGGSNPFLEEGNPATFSVSPYRLCRKEKLAAIGFSRTGLGHYWITGTELKMAATVATRPTCSSTTGPSGAQQYKRLQRVKILDELLLGLKMRILINLD